MTNTKTSPKSKVKQSETVTVKRSQIKMAPYNPRKKDPKIVDALKANFKRVGFLGGLVWNSVTGNLVAGHKRTEALDLIYGYDGTPEKDYDIKVERVELDEKTEKEQNIFLNNRRAQGVMDYSLLAEILPTIDYKMAALEEIDLQAIEAAVPNFKMGAIQEIQEDMEGLNPVDKKNHVQGVKAAMKGDVQNTQQATHFTIAFKTYEEKAEYLEGLGLNGDDTLFTGAQFIKALNG